MRTLYRDQYAAGARHQSHQQSTQAYLVWFGFFGGVAVSQRNVQQRVERHEHRDQQLCAVNPVPIPVLPPQIPAAAVAQSMEHDRKEILFNRARKWQRTAAPQNLAELSTTITGRQPLGARLSSVALIRSILVLLFGLSISAPAQTKLKLSAIKPGTEQVQLVPNGDFQFQGPFVGGAYPTPAGWSRSGDMFATSGSNMVTWDGGVSAQAQLLSGAPASGYSQSVTLEPATAYVFSGYLWNMGDAANHVNTVIDFNDAPGEPQVVLSAADSEADKGYFVYRSFNTSTTGTNVTVRVFYDGVVGTGASASYCPGAAQWDNIAITRASSFLAPQAAGSSANLRPQVTITNPANGSFIYVNSSAGGVHTSSSRPPTCVA